MRLLSMILATLLVSAASAAQAPLQKAQSGTVHRHYIYSPQLAETVTIDVWTPPGYDASDTGHLYPVIYMHDGQNLFDANTTWNHQAWELDSVVPELMARGEVEAPVIVGIHSRSESRVGDLSPQKALVAVPDTTMQKFLRHSDKPIRGDAYAAFLATTLREAMDSTYRLRTDAASTFVMGSSMGGLMSIYAMCEYPEVFGGAGCLSTHWVGALDGDAPADDFPQALYEYLEEKIPVDGEHRVYLDHGTVGLDALYEPWNSRMVSLLESKGYDSRTLQNYVAEGAEHMERYWKLRVEKPLIFLLGE